MGGSKRTGTLLLELSDLLSKPSHGFTVLISRPHREEGGICGASDTCSVRRWQSWLLLTLRA